MIGLHTLRFSAKIRDGISTRRPSLFFVLLVLFLGILLIAGGASRPDVWGQVVVRVCAWFCLIITILFGSRPTFKSAKPVAFFLLAILMIVLLQLVPLPPSIWQSLPGHGTLAEAAVASGQSQSWRSWSIVPSATVNAASSCIVPLMTLVLVNGLKEEERYWVPGLLLCLIVASTLTGLIQFSGMSFDNPFVNGAEQVSGTFANRNHFALFLAFGCLVAPAWAFLKERRSHWRFVALGLVILFSLMILASGSRAGMVVGIFALCINFPLVGGPIKKSVKYYPRWVFPSAILTILLVISIFILISVESDRAVSIRRALALTPDEDMRSRAFPTILKMIWTYFPWGSGVGGFDPVFRMHEPLRLLSSVYLNHAHNDFLEVVLDAGILGIILLSSALIWWIIYSICAWRFAREGREALPRLGSALFFLVIMASVFDYPVRTPIMMAMVVIAGVWLGGGGAPRRAALPADGRPL